MIQGFQASDNIGTSVHVPSVGIGGTRTPIPISIEIVEVVGDKIFGIGGNVVMNGQDMVRRTINILIGEETEVSKRHKKVLLASDNVNSVYLRVVKLILREDSFHVV